jgi:two-component system chemotaxis response regulator CheY
VKPSALVISDWKLAGTSGLELLQRIREDAALKDTRFLLMTASSHPQLADTVSRLGANGFLIKPFSAGALRAAQAFRSGA